MLEAMQHDKKVVAGRLHFVLPTAIGATTIVDDVTEKEMKTALRTALRVKAHYLAFVTLAFSTLIWLILRNEQWLTGGVFGLSNIPRPSFFGLKLDGALAFHRFVVIVTLILAIALWWMIRSPWGRAFTALRENPIRAASLGIDTRMYTLLAFAIGSAYAGFAGALYAPLVEFIDPSPFSLSQIFLKVGSWPRSRHRPAARPCTRLPGPRRRTAAAGRRWPAAASTPAGSPGRSEHPCWFAVSAALMAIAW